MGALASRVALGRWARGGGGSCDYRGQRLAFSPKTPKNRWKEVNKIWVKPMSRAICLKGDGRVGILNRLFLEWAFNPFRTLLCPFKGPMRIKMSLAQCMGKISLESKPSAYFF